LFGHSFQESFRNSLPLSFLPNLPLQTQILFCCNPIINPTRNKNSGNDISNDTKSSRFFCNSMEGVKDQVFLFLRSNKCRVPQRRSRVCVVFRKPLKPFVNISILRDFRKSWLKDISNSIGSQFNVKMQDQLFCSYWRINTAVLTEDCECVTSKKSDQNRRNRS
jgi:hypothetical protein